MNEEYFENYLQRLLTRGAYTCWQIQDKLIKKGAAEEVAHTLVEKYTELGFLDDEAYSILYVASHVGWGDRKLRDELRRRKVSPTIIQKVLEEAETDEVHRACVLAQEWKRHDVDSRKIWGRLIRRGFSASSCKIALERTCEPFR
ncbi:MAG: regulatory protein RecX [Aminobacterium sp.]|jgi:regulatory protein|uniref:regulatory protein RecX n=1 Tax=unclassified Aminobacterium TaxID=2685012 RepID=UPI001BD19EBB|nr:MULTISPECIES: regulatory protein RecX [unclassified Aminobacterium]MDD2206156.1 regulatory protein RecX [Aminobacterium sp.]MDD3425451.1 regulatory protein RecX [Aminobacterium sp.]MDD3707055.1 regulatory protein RecX [Aminobacterium sp.]MDD4551153.1 regulatory protein RecX [Aminobacterium sp.]MEA4876415.1 regulatory protein RecX [Aminobacterium sp.]